MSRVPIVAAAMLLLGGFVGTCAASDVYHYSTNGTGVFSSTLSPNNAIQYFNDGPLSLYGEYYYSAVSCTIGNTYSVRVGITSQDGTFQEAWLCNELPVSKSGAHGVNPTKSLSVHSYSETDAYVYATLLITTSSPNTISGSTGCVEEVALYIDTDSGYQFLKNYTLSQSDSYTFNIYQPSSYRITFDNVYHDFTCEGDDIVFDYDACIWVYGYTCGVDTIKLYNDTGGWVLDDTESQDVGYDVYEMAIVGGEDYKISFIDSTIDGDFVVHNQTFSCTGDHVLIDFDRCEWIYPISPPAPPYIIYLWTGYDYNIVVFKDEHGNFIENSQLAIYDKTDGQYIQRWTDASDGYALLGAKFAADHDVQLSLRTFDGIFTLDTTFPANGSAEVGEEDITTTNWTIPIKYNLNVLPVDQYGASLFDVFCGLSEYTPLNPGAFWGMDLSDRGYVPVTNCSGFAMCNIIAEKDGYADYKVEALNWTSKSALVKDYRHNVVMEEE